MGKILSSNCRGIRPGNQRAEELYFALAAHTLDGFCIRKSTNSNNSRSYSCSLLSRSRCSHENFPFCKNKVKDKGRYFFRPKSLYLQAKGGTFFTHPRKYLFGAVSGKESVIS